MYPIQWDTGVYATRAEFAKDVQQAYKMRSKPSMMRVAVIYN